MSDGRGGASVPPYPFQHSGAVIVCGNAWCLQEDFEAARALYPDAPVIAVNGAAGQVKAFALFSMHPRKLPKWIAMQRRFGDGFTVHAGGGLRHDRPKFKRTSDAMPWVQYWWPGAAHGGTSVWCARRMAKQMGFGLVVLCGAPLSIGGYAGGRMAKAFQQEDTIRHYRGQIEADTMYHDGVRSMSGWTREVFGAPA